MLGKHKPQDLLNQSDASALRPAEDAEWLALSDQGRQLWAQIDQTMLRVKSVEEKVYSSAVVREQLGMGY